MSRRCTKTPSYDSLLAYHCHQCGHITQHMQSIIAESKSVTPFPKFCSGCGHRFCHVRTELREVYERTRNALEVAVDVKTAVKTAVGKVKGQCVLKAYWMEWKCWACGCENMY